MCTPILQAPFKLRAKIHDQFSVKDKILRRLGYDGSAIDFDAQLNRKAAGLPGIRRTQGAKNQREADDAKQAAIESRITRPNSGGL